MPDAPPPQAVDYSGRPLAVGDRVTFILSFDNQLALYTGRIALIGKEQVCVESSTLHVVSGQKWTPTGRPEGIRYATIARKPDGDA